MKKTLALALVLVLASSLTACGGAPGSGISSAASAPLPQSASAPPSAVSASVQTPPHPQSTDASGTGNSQALPDMPGVLPEVPPVEERTTLLAETAAERTYLIRSVIHIPGGEKPSPLGGFAYTVTVPVPLYIEGNHIEIPGHFKTLYSDDQLSLKLTDHGSTLFFPNNGTPEEFIFPGGKNSEGPGLDDGPGHSEPIEHGAIELDGNRTLYYNYYHSTYEFNTYIYNAAVDLGGGLSPYFTFIVFDGLTPAEWRERPVFTSILASVKPYDGE